MSEKYVVFVNSRGNHLFCINKRDRTCEIHKALLIPNPWQLLEILNENLYNKYQAMTIDEYARAFPEKRKKAMQYMKRKIREGDLIRGDVANFTFTTMKQTSIDLFLENLTLIMGYTPDLPVSRGNRRMGDGSLSPVIYTLKVKDWYFNDLIKYCIDRGL